MIQDRINIAVALLKEGHAFGIDGILLHVVAPDIMSVTGFTSHQLFENVSKSNVIEDLGNLKLQFQEMIDTFEILRDFVAGKKFHYFIGHDIGKAAIPICKEIEGELTWLNDHIRK